MAQWQVQKAKAHLSELLEEAAAEGPQIITRHGTEHAVVMSISDYRALMEQQLNFRDYLLGGPKVKSFDLKRSRDTGRTVRL